MPQCFSADRRTEGPCKVLRQSASDGSITFSLQSPACVVLFCSRPWFTPPPPPPPRADGEQDPLEKCKELSVKLYYQVLEAMLDSESKRLKVSSHRVATQCPVCVGQRRSLVVLFRAIFVWDF